MLARMQGDKSKITACKIQRHDSGLDVRKGEFEYYSTSLESIFSLRLPDETYRGIINFTGANVRDTPKDQIEKALVSDQNNIKSLDLRFLSKYVHNNRLQPENFTCLQKTVVSCVEMRSCTLCHREQHTLN